VIARLRRRRKERAELEWWRERLSDEVAAGSGHYEHLFTRTFGLEPGFYAGKRVLDVGCGPRGSLEWAIAASMRVGADPLADAYVRELGAAAHGMSYVQAPAEALPFEDGTFDVVACLNALDHVDSPDGALSEMARVLAVGGLLLLIVEVGHEPTPTEPHALGWDLADQLPAGLVAQLVRPLRGSAASVYESVFAGEEADPQHDASGILVLSARRS
jgi:ubiquinone/menaquinone biosynthesis C-methylase UbiE